MYKKRQNYVQMEQKSKNYFKLLFIFYYLVKVQKTNFLLNKNLNLIHLDFLILDFKNEFKV